MRVLVIEDDRPTRLLLERMIRSRGHEVRGCDSAEAAFELLSGEFFGNKEFEKYNRILVGEDESYAANSLWVNGKVLVPDGFPATRKKIEEAGYETIIMDVSEFRKLDGGLSCLSLRWESQ